MLLYLVQPFLRATVSREFQLQSLMPVRFGFFTCPYTIVPLLHRRMACILNSLYLYLHSHMLLDLVQPIFEAEVSLKFAEISIRQWFLLRFSL